MKKVKAEKSKEKNESKEQVDALKSQLARVLADYDNLRKRVEEEKGTWLRVAGARVIERFLGIYDMLISAQGHINDSGLAIVLGEFKKTIEEEGFEEIAVKIGETAFDSKLMEAVEVVSTEEEEKKEKVAEVVLSGWKSKTEDFVLRPAKVKVFGNDK